MNALTRLQPGGYTLDALNVPPVTAIDLDAAYLLGAGDTALARPGAESAARLGAETRIVTGGRTGLPDRSQESASLCVSCYEHGRCPGHRLLSPNGERRGVPGPRFVRGETLTAQPRHPVPCHPAVGRVRKIDLIDISRTDLVWQKNNDNGRRVCGAHQDCATDAEGSA